MQISTTQIITWTISVSVASLIIVLLFVYRLIILHIKNKSEMTELIGDLIIEKDKQVLISKIKTQEDTMDKISKEIHDNINQVLALSKLNLDIAIMENNQINTNLKLSQDFLIRGIVELNNISKGLGADFIKETGLLRSMEIECERINLMNRTQIYVYTDGDFVRPGEEVEIVLYRIFQEVIKNAMLHGKASEVEIKIKCSGHLIECSFKDNGIGFELDNYNSPNNLHSGLKNIKKRISALDGDLEINSILGSGTNIVVKVPTKIL